MPHTTSKPPEIPGWHQADRGMHVPGEYIIYFPPAGANGVLYAPDEPPITDDAIGEYGGLLYHRINGAWHNSRFGSPSPDQGAIRVVGRRT